MASSKYRYDINIGHYVLLLEGELPLANSDANTTLSTTETTDGTENQNQELNQVQPINLDSEEVVAMRLEKENALKQIQDEIKKKSDNIVQCQLKVADLQAANGTDLATLSDAQKVLIQAEKELSDKNLELALKTNDYDDKIFLLLMKLLESIALAKETIPAKYQFLNESNVQNAKVYITKIFENDYQQRIKGMVDFKKAFVNSNLLYGKDKDGYFVICLDQEDLNKLTTTLTEIGFDKDEIYSVVLSQMFDRSDLVKA